MLSRKSLLIFFILSLCLGLMVGCDEDENLVPVLTRVQANAECGVAPMIVQFLAIASGGDQLDDPTGGNSFLNYDWNFDDGTTGTGSITSHTFDEPGDYDVVISVTDNDDDRVTLTLPIEVRADSLVVTTTPDTSVVASLAYFDTPTPRASNGDPAGRPVDTGLVINEVLVYNESTISDNIGQFGPYMELLNTGDEAIELLGFALTTDPFVPRMYTFGTNADLNPGEHLIV
jgi:PKD domain